MSKYIFIFCLILFCACSTKVKHDNAVIEFAENSFDFGSLKYQKGMEHNFKFTNPGKTPLIIYDVKTSCGCTIPEWTKKPVKPDENGEIKIKYDADFPGMFRKTIKVYFNGKDSPKELSIKGKVTYPEDLKGAEDEE